MFKLRKHQKQPGTKKMLTPVNKTFIQDLCFSRPWSEWTFNLWRCAKGKKVKLQ